MKVMQVFKERVADAYHKKTPTIAFFGDSVTQGCFDVYVKNDGGIETYFDKNHAYHHYVAQIFAELFPSVPVNIINAGISGDNAPNGLTRIDRDVLKFQPDLTVVCFGLNDSTQGLDKLENYTQALEEIFHQLQSAGSEVLLMTPNMMCTEVSCHIHDERIRKIAENIANIQNSGTLDQYVDAARKVAEKCNVPIVDVYAKWKKMDDCGVDITGLLANKINHPSEKMNWLFAISLVEAMLS